MTQRLSAQERKHQLLTLLHSVFTEAQTQQDFTAAQLARQAGISGVLFYRLVGPEYQALKCQLPGLRQTSETELSTLRKEVVQLREALQEVRAQLRRQSAEDYHEAICLIEQLERENLALRGEVQLLQQRLVEGGHVYILPTNRATRGGTTQKD